MVRDKPRHVMGVEVSNLCGLATSHCAGDGSTLGCIHKRRTRHVCIIPICVDLLYRSHSRKDDLE